MLDVGGPLAAAPPGGPGFVFAEHKNAAAYVSVKLHLAGRRLGSSSSLSQ